MHETIFTPDAFDIFTNPAYKKYRKDWIDYPKTRYVSNFPLNLDIHVTNKCNLSCVMCRRTQEVKKGLLDKTGFLNFALYRKIVDQAAKEGCCAVHLTGNGEPLLDKDIIEMIKYAHGKKILDVFMHTNATLMTEDVAKKLLHAGLTRLIISVDSPVKQTYENIRRGAKFEIVRDNINALARIKKEMNLSYPLIRIQMVEMKANQKERALFDKVFGKIVDSIGHCSYINYKGLDEENRSIYPKVWRRKFVCQQLWQRLTIEWDGKVYACLVINKDLFLGDANKKTIKEMWHGSVMDKLRERHKAGESASIKACQQCGRQYKALK